MRNPYPQFVWFIGVVEETGDDPSKLGRVRVRAVGFHPSAELLPTAQLPLAPVLNGGSVRIVPGQMVLGFFMDGEETQQPFVLGVIGGGAAGSNLFSSYNNLIQEWFGPKEEFPQTPQLVDNSPSQPNPEGYVNPLGNGWYTVVAGGQYGVFRQYYNKNRGGNHAGVDLAAPAGTNVYAAKDGSVVKAEYSSSYGHVVYINHDDGYQTRYAHLLNSPLVKAGTRVTQNQLLGQVGNSGASRGNHLHYEVRSNSGNGSSVDPSKFGGPFKGK